MHCYKLNLHTPQLTRMMSFFAGAPPQTAEDIEQSYRYKVATRLQKGIVLS